MSCQNYEQVVRFLCGALRLGPTQVSPHTRLLHDLGVDGDDAEEILVEFAKRFEVDLSTFKFRSHFGSEFGTGIRWLVRKVHGGDAIRFAPVTVQDLVDAAGCGRWIERGQKAQIQR